MIISNFDSVTHLESNPGLTRRDERDYKVVSGTWRGHAKCLQVEVMVASTSNNTVCGFEPTEYEPREIWIFDGDTVEYISGCAEWYPELTVRRRRR